MRRAKRSRRVGPALSVLALALAWATGLQQAHAAPAAAHWTLTDIGTLGGTSARATGINAGGIVVGASNNPSGLNRAFDYDGQTMRDLGSAFGNSSSEGRAINDAGTVTGWVFTAGFRATIINANGAGSILGTLGGADSLGNAINRSGQIAGQSNLVGNGASHAFLYTDGVMSDLGALGGTNSIGTGINDAGQVTGWSNVASGFLHAFRYSNGTMNDLGTLGGRNSAGNAINASGQVTGYSFVDNASYHAFVATGSTMQDIGTLGGNTGEGYAINTAGQVTGYSTTAAGDEHAFFYTQGTMVDLNSLPGVAGNGRVLQRGTGLNDAGQITGVFAPTNSPRAFVLTLDTTVWQGGTGGAWDNSNGWAYGIAPNRNTAVLLDPVRSTTLYGPGSDVSVKSMSVGGDASGGNGVATLVLNGGRISVGVQGTMVTSKGVLTGDGALTGTVTNFGTVTAQNLTLTEPLINHGLVNGSGRLATHLRNESDGLLQVGPGQTFTLLGAGGHSNDGRIEVTGSGSLVLDGPLQNSGQLTLQGATLRSTGYVGNFVAGRINLGGGSLVEVGALDNVGTLNVGFGGAQISGQVLNRANTGRIILSGNSNTTFYDDVTAEAGSELRVSAGSAALFFGAVLQRTGARFTGSGTKFYEGGLSIGASPGLGTDEGDVVFGGSNVYAAEVAGRIAGSGFDKYIVAGQLHFGGVLKIMPWGGFQLNAGDRFDLFDWGSSSGSFSAIDTSAVTLAPGLAWDFSQLYLNGEVGVTAALEPTPVPEPGAWALWLAGLGVLAQRGRRALREQCER